MRDGMSFGELVGLMVWGRGEPDAFRGVVRTVDADGGERFVRLARRGALSREERLDGTVIRIVGERASWFLDSADATMRTHVHERSPYADYATAPIGGLDIGGPRPSWARWTGTDFTTPTGPVTETQFLGRPAWAVELAPPEHKPFPLQLVVDAATGLVLRRTNTGFGTVEEWVELDLEPQLPDELFEWTGPARPMPTRADREAEWRAEAAQRTAWLAQRGLATVVVPVACEVELHERDDASAGIYAGIDTAVSATLLRRPRSPAEWPEPDTTHYAHSWRWTDDTWDWFLATDLALDDAALASIKAQLAAST